MGEALLAALLRKKIFSPRDIAVTTAHSENRQRLRRKYKIQALGSNRELAGRCQILLVAVKPQQMHSVLAEIGTDLGKRPLISIAAGLDSSFYRRYLPAGTRLIRAMPNSPVRIGKGITGIYFPPSVSRRGRATVLRLFSAVGPVLVVSNETWLDIITAVSGSGPAFVYLFLQSLIEAATGLGLPKEIARRFSFQTVLGATELAQEAKESLESLISKVASKGGTTEAGLKVLRRGFPLLVRRAIEKATERGRELRRQIRGGSCIS